MSEVIGKVHGKHHTYEIQKVSHTLTASQYYVVRDDGKSFGAYGSRARAFEVAHEKAGPDSYEPD